MSTTRHHINRQRRRQARDARPTASGASSGLAVLPERTPAPRPPRASAPPAPEATRAPDAPRPADATRTADTTDAPRPAGPSKPAERRVLPRPSRPVGLALLCLLTLLLGGFAGWAHARAQGLRDEPARRNTALTDPARTSEIKGQAEKAVAALFSYDHAHPAAFDKARKELLTGKAAGQHRALLDGVRTRADQQKAVITTTVTDSAVERIDGERARVLVYADQSSVSTAGSEGKGATGTKGTRQTEDQGTYAGAMFAIDVVHRDGRWLVSGIDTFGR
jgi:Mce-associated membrane protein